MPSALVSCPPQLTLSGVEPGNDRFDSTLGLDAYAFPTKQAHNPWPLVVGVATAGAGPPDGPRPVTTMQAETSATATATTVPAPSSPVQSKAIDPAAIPTRTSSTRAMTNGDKHPSSPKNFPRHRHSLSSVPEASRRRPEVNEKDWIAAARSPRISMPPTYSNTSATNGNFSYSGTLLPPFNHTASAKPIPKGPTLASSEAPLTSQPTTWTPTKESILRGPYTYLDSHPGKDIRSQLIAAFNSWLEVPPTSLAIISKVIGMLHTASLLVDDVEDSSSLRRGVPVAHSIFGTAQTINSANYIYFCALQELLQLESARSGGQAVRIYTEELVNLHRGQGMDLYWRDTLTCPTEDEYLEMVGNKTGGLFRLAIKLMCAESPSHQEALRRAADPPTEGVAGQHDDAPTTTEVREGSKHIKPDYIPLANTIGLLFQILDDYLNLASPKYTANKGLCEDLTEGKFSFPIIHAIRSDPANLTLLNILRQKTTDEAVKGFACEEMERLGSFRYTRGILGGLEGEARRLVGFCDRGRGRGEGVLGILEKLRVE